MSKPAIRKFRMGDYDEALSLWRSTEGIGLGDSDTREAVAFFLERNPGMSFVATVDERIVGAALCGHDGRRGYLHHLAVATPFRSKGLGKTLTQACLAALDREGIRKCNIFVYTHNREGREFWTRNKWNRRTDLEVLQRWTKDTEV